MGVRELVDFAIYNHFFPSFQIRSELLGLGSVLAAMRPARALEIGTAQGGTLLLLTRLASPSAAILSVDLPGGSFGGGYSQRRAWCYRRFARRHQKLHLIWGDSHDDETLQRVKSSLGGQPLDYLFIDGDHSYEGVKRDFELYSALVRPDGIVAFHDIVEGPGERVGGVPRFWREIRSQYRFKEFVHDPLQQGMGIGVLYID